MFVARRNWRTNHGYEMDTNVNVCASLDFFNPSIDIFFFCCAPSLPFPFFSFLPFLNRIEKFACTRQRTFYDLKAL